MQITRLIERMYCAIDHGKSGAAFADIVGQCVAVLNAGQRRAHVAKNRIASAVPDMMKKFTPAKLESELVFKRQLGQLLEQLGYRDEPMRQIWRESRDLAIEMIAGFGISRDVNRGDGIGQR